MAEKVYGFCENKCKAEVIPAENILVLRGKTGTSSSLSIEANSTYGFEFSLPTGWTVENTVFLGMSRYFGEADSQGSIGYTYAGNKFAMETTVGIHFLSNNKIQIILTNTKSETVTIKGAFSFLFFKQPNIFGDA